MDIDYYLVDVFTKKPFSGNSLTIFSNAKNLGKEFMQVLTQEMRQFESLFFYQIDSRNYRAFIFTIEEELDFAGHPLLGLASLIHSEYSKEKSKNKINIELNEKTVEIETTKENGFYSASMNQGIPEFIHSLNETEISEFLSYLSLGLNDKHENSNLEVITTGLPYLIIPVKSNSLSKVKVSISDLENKLSKIGAKFFYVLDIENRRGRTWDNFGLVEDIATGSSAGPVGAYLVKNGFENFNEQIKLSQGEFLNRESELRVIVTGKNNEFNDVLVEGDVVEIGHGKITTANTV